MSEQHAITEQDLVNIRSDMVKRGVPTLYNTPRGPRQYVPTEQVRTIGATPRMGDQYHVIGPNPRWLVAEIVAPEDGLSWHRLTGRRAIALVSDTQAEIDLWNKLFQRHSIPGVIRRLRPGDPLPEWNLQAARLLGIQLSTEFVMKAQVAKPTFGKRVKSWWYRFRAQQVERWRDLKASRVQKENDDYD